MIYVHRSFFDQAERIASMTYEPTPGAYTSRIFEVLLLSESIEDILRARLRTVGVEEHRLVMETRKSIPLPFTSAYPAK